MALSIVSIPGDGVTDTFTVSFALGILDRNSTTAWVTGEVDGGGNKVFRTITYLTDTMLQISGPPAGVGVMVVFTRTVSQTALIVDYEDGDIMNEENLNTAQKQALMLVHQVLDGRFSAFIQDVSAGGFRITNLGTPTAASDAVNKAYVDGLISTGSASAAAAAASAAQAASSASSAAISQGVASSFANFAMKWSSEEEDVNINDGINPVGFSSFHWSKKSEDYAIAAAASAASIVIGPGGVQAYDADLNAIAGLTTTAYGRGLLTLADQAAFSNETVVTQTPLTGAVSRPAIAKLRDGPVSLEDFGYVSGNALAAMNLALASGAPIKLKKGKYQINGLLNTVTNTPVSLEGHGPGMSILEFTGATSGITISQNDFTNPTFVRNLLLQTTQQEAGDALTITYSKADSITNRAVARCTLEDIWMWGDNVLASGWRKGLVLTDIFALQVSRPVIVGRKNNSLTGVAIFKNMTAGIELVGSDTPTMSAVPGNIHIDNPQVSHSNKGIYSRGEVEGLFITKPVGVAVDYGIDVAYTTKRPLTDIRGGHMEAFTIGVRLVKAVQSFVTGMCIYKSPITHTDTYGIHMTDCDDTSVTDIAMINQSQANDAAVDGEFLGIVNNSGNNCVIDNIRHQRPSKTVIIGGTSTNCNTSRVRTSGTYPNATVATYDDTSSGANVYSAENTPIFAGHNTGAVSIATGTTVLSTPSRNVYKGERYLIQANITSTKGGTGGESLLFVNKSGTCTGVFAGGGRASLLARSAHAASTDVGMNAGGIFTVTVSGTLTLTLAGTSTGSNGNCAIGEGNLTVTLL